MISMKKCGICGEMKDTNIIVLRNNICVDCESKIVEMNVDKEEYMKYLDGIKKIVEPLYNQT